MAGPTALLIAKLHKIHDRVDAPSRLDNKDAHDIYRLLRAVDTDVLVEVSGRLLDEEVSAEVTRDALGYLGELFAEGPDARGSVMAGAAEELVGDPIAVAESVALLAQDLLAALDSSTIRMRSSDPEACDAYERLQRHNASRCACQTTGSQSLTLPHQPPAQVGSSRALPLNSVASGGRCSIP